MSLKPCILVVACSLWAWGPAQTYVGAGGALRTIKNPAPPAPVKPDPTAALRRSIAAYERAAGELSSAQSARRWLALVDRCKPTHPAWGPPEGILEDSVLQAVMSALPAPPVWPTLDALVRMRVSTGKPAPRDLALLAMVETLEGRRDGAWRHLSMISGLAPQQQGQITALFVDLGLVSERKEWIEIAYRKQAKDLSRESHGGGGSKAMELPDLSALLGPNRARTLLADVFHILDGEVVVHGSDSFKRLASETALAEVVALKRP